MAGDMMIEEVRRYRYIFLILTDIVLINMSFILSSYFVYGNKVTYSFNNKYLF
ncbi:hypothetical protein PL321_18505 [Caloramator sp. mosi_1]|nr:hypothetical protein [Caloramator sp. mosi_1]WDC84202.1 hypothetical protein PL321_18505 [Caloramator sp. mosi_1]